MADLLQKGLCQISWAEEGPRLQVRGRGTSQQPKEEFTDGSDRQTMTQFDSGKGELSIHGNMQEVTK